MLDNAAKENISLFGEVLENLRQVSLRAFEKKDKFLPLYHTIKFIHPYLNNAILYCNEHLGAQLPYSDNHSRDLFVLAAEDQDKIKHLYSFLKQNGYVPEAHIGLDAEENNMFLGKLLRKIDNLSENEQRIQHYFMRGIIESAAAVAAYGRQYCKSQIADDIDNSDVPEKVSAILEKQGVAISEDDEDSVYNVLYQECGNLISKRHAFTPKDLSKSIAHTLSEYFKFDENMLTPLLESQTEKLCDFVKKAKKSMRKYQAVFRELGLFSQNLRPAEHEDIETEIYSKDLPQPVNQLITPAKIVNGVPDYLLPYLNAPEYLEVQRQKPIWDAYEKQAENFNDKDIHSILSLMSVSVIKELYRDFDSINDMLEVLSEQKDDEEEDNMKKYVSWPQEMEVLDFAHDLLIATDLCQHFSSLELNNTGVTVETVYALQKKGNLTSQDIGVLGEVFDALESEMEEASDVINLSVVPEYQESWNLIKKMPHGAERQKALTCLSLSLGLSCSDVCDEMESLLFDIDAAIGHTVPTADDILLEFLADSKYKYSDLNGFEPEILAENIHKGVVASYLLPKYLEIEPDGSEPEAAVSFIEGYDCFEPETKQYLLKLTQYYADKVMSFQDEKVVITDELAEKINDYNDCHVFMHLLDNTQMEVEEALDEEKKITLEYNKYKQQKEIFELPKNMDVLIAAQFYRTASRSL